MMKGAANRLRLVMIWYVQSMTKLKRTNDSSSYLFVHFLEISLFLLLNVASEKSSNWKSDMCFKDFTENHKMKR